MPALQTQPQAQSPSVKAEDLSVVVVTWNTRELTRNCLRSVLDNAGTLALELFVIDNASDDGSAQMIREEFPSAKLIRNDRNRGFAAANNQALGLTSGRYILLLNSDTLILSDVLQKSVQYMDEHSVVGVFGCRVLNPDRTLQPTCFEYPSLLNLFLLTSGLSRLSWPRFFGKYLMSGWNRDSEREVDVVTGCYMFIRQAALREVGFMDEAFFFFAEETDWCKSFRKRGWSVRFAPVGQIIHYGGASIKLIDQGRGILLTHALIAFHRKHGGPIAAFLAWALLLIFNVSRYIGWLLIWAFGRSDKAARRRDQFKEILINFPSIWKSAEAYR